MNFYKFIATIFFTFAITVANATTDNDDVDDLLPGDTEMSDEGMPYISENEELEALFSVTGDEIVGTALKYLGRPYRTGMTCPYAFDCSGFTSFVYRNLKIGLHRCSRAQYTQGISINREELRAGDLVFFSGSRGGRTVGHVGIVTAADGQGDFKFVHASRSGIKVDKFNNSSYYIRRYIGARRILDF